MPLIYQNSFFLLISHNPITCAFSIDNVASSSEHLFDRVSTLENKTFKEFFLSLEEK